MDKVKAKDERERKENIFKGSWVWSVARMICHGFGTNDNNLSTPCLWHPHVHLMVLWRRNQDVTNQQAIPIVHEENSPPLKPSGQLSLHEIFPSGVTSICHCHRGFHCQYASPSLAEHTWNKTKYFPFIPVYPKNSDMYNLWETTAHIRPDEVKLVSIFPSLLWGMLQPFFEDGDYKNIRIMNSNWHNR